MNHPSDDELLLLAYGELPVHSVALVEAHVTHCAVCQATLAGLERARVALDVALPARRRRAPLLAAVALVAAVVAGVLITRPDPARERPSWTLTKEWSATAGYVTGGSVMKDIDAQLTRLEQERHYDLPN